ncbi:hypothetical protein H6P81_008092 [Aristolochia fimbriata]|uniref:HIG1 domain-containing protein n=1 Tax=Aristolochia fimbriata TaxID=158543 RepID=A0AAV7F2D5_ARIFI|nr:hypothetical protein H6P81_008092 [Aristolochia fimbriata]
MDSVKSWVSEHKLTSIGTVWASAILGSLAYNRAAGTAMKPGLRIIHARLHAQALTLAVLSGAAVVHYWEPKPGVPPAENAHFTG